MYIATVLPAVNISVMHGYKLSIVIKETHTLELVTQ